MSENIRIVIILICTVVHFQNQHTYIPLQDNIHVSEVHCGSAVWFGQALPGFLLTVHHLLCASMFCNRVAVVWRYTKPKTKEQSWVIKSVLRAQSAVNIGRPRAKFDRLPLPGVHFPHNRRAECSFSGFIPTNKQAKKLSVYMVGNKPRT